MARGGLRHRIQYNTIHGDPYHRHHWQRWGIERCNFYNHVRPLCAVIPVQLFCFWLLRLGGLRWFLGVSKVLIKRSVLVSLWWREYFVIKEPFYTELWPLVCRTKVIRVLQSLITSTPGQRHALPSGCFFGFLELLLWLSYDKPVTQDQWKSVCVKEKENLLCKSKGDKSNNNIRL